VTGTNTGANATFAPVDSGSTSSSRAVVNGRLRFSINAQPGIATAAASNNSSIVRMIVPFNGVPRIRILL